MCCQYEKTSNIYVNILNEFTILVKLCRQLFKFIFKVLKMESTSDSDNGNRKQFGTRFLNNQENVFQHNAW